MELVLSKLIVVIEKWAVWRDLNLLLLDRVGMVVVLWRRNFGGRRWRIVRRRYELAGNGGVGCA